MEDYQPVPLPDRNNYSEAQIQQRADDYYRLIRRRHSVRHFSDKPVARSVIETCIRSAGTAPSGANHQPWHFVCVNDADTKRKIRIAAEHEEEAFYSGRASDEWLADLDKMGTDANKPFLETAPWLIAVFLQRSGVDDRGNKRKHYYMSESVGIATGFLLSALHAAGLATLTHTPNPMKFLSQILGRPANERPYMLLVVGHPAENATMPAAALVKKPLEVIASFID
ncbi:nitroreductase family protein [Seongchinamella unica]|uniref:Nitroreductase family protein n=2 Tax=Seongchinamella unica TaxID=2547392 RepID=A0A4R5LTH9_9GAMM|nr:nitroreductase family protein [Seongchinamella unica]TDG14263.1 nitroreductase family protein [Seongchinamella unica]